MLTDWVLSIFLNIRFCLVCANQEAHGNQPRHLPVRDPACGLESAEHIPSHDLIISQYVTFTKADYVNGKQQEQVRSLPSDAIAPEDCSLAGAGRAATSKSVI
jgi:hypothetical protein